MSAQRDYREDDGADFRESLQADAQTLANRGFASNFCAAWLAFWRWALVVHGERLEEASRLTFPDTKPKTAEKIVAGVSRSTMALLSAAVRADKFKSQRRRFACASWMLESYRDGLELVSDELPPEERKKRRANLSRYWRRRWADLHLFMCVTQLPLVTREAKDWQANRERHDAAAYVEQASELLFEVMGRGGWRRGVSRVRVFELAVESAVENFRARFGDYAPGYVMPEPRADADAPAPKGEAAPRRGRLIPFPKVRAKLAEAVEAFMACAYGGQVTPEEADAFLAELAPAVEIAARIVSAKEDGVTSADTGGNEPAKSTPVSDEANPVFSGEFEVPAPVSADKNIRIEDPALVTLDAFLAAFRPDPAEPLRLRAFAPKEAPEDDPRFWARDGRKFPTTRRALASGGAMLAKLREVNRAHGVYFVVNQGGDCDADITRVTAFFAEADEGTIAEQHANLDACPLPPNVRVETRKSVHAYWLAAPGCSIEEWREVQRRLIHYFKADPKIKNPSRVMRLPHFNHVCYTGGQLDFKTVTLAAFDTSRRFTAAELLAAFPAPPAPPRPRPFDVRRAGVSPGGLEEHKRELGARIAAHESAGRNSSGNWDCRGVCHGGKGHTGLFYNPSRNTVTCNAQMPCDLATISRAFGMKMPGMTPGVPRVNDGRERGTI